jgi:TP901-1 family phage major tail protein
MSAQRGKDILLKIEGAGGAFTTVAGLRARTISLNAKTVDATDSDSAGAVARTAGGGGREVGGGVGAGDIPRRGLGTP